MKRPLLLHELLTVNSNDPDKVAIIDGDRSFRRSELLQAVETCASKLVSCGLQRGERVGILLPKSFEECAAIFAVSRAGGVVVPINPLLKPQQVAHILADCGAVLLISKATLVDQLVHLPGVAVKVIVAESDELLSVAVSTPNPTAISEDLAAILYTSGSTGQPKGVMLSHANMLAGTRIVSTYLNITAQDRILSLLPFSFDYGLNQLLTSVEQGALLVLGSFKLGDHIVSALVRHQITGLAGVPTIWAVLTKAAPMLTKSVLPNLRYITNSGGAVPEATVHRLSALLPTTEIYLMYGLTEAFRSTYLPPTEVARRPTSIGKAIPECEVFPVTEDGRRAKQGEAGILVHRGPTVSLGYWNRPDDTANVIRPNPVCPPELGGGMVCWSGDLVVEDEDGFLYFVGRNDTLIKSAGYRLSPTEVENELMSTGSFRQVAVIGLPDEWLGQRLCAVGVAADGAVSIPTVLQQLSTRLPSHMVPSRIDVVEELPQTPNGKVDYRALVLERSKQ